MTPLFAKSTNKALAPFSLGRLLCADVLKAAVPGVAKKVCSFTREKTGVAANKAVLMLAIASVFLISVCVIDKVLLVT